MKNKGGRPKVKIDRKTFEGLCKIQCTKDEICRFFSNDDGKPIDEKTLTRWCKDTYDVGFSEVYKRFECHGNISLRRYQFDLAKRNTAMAIFLGKNKLNQTDKQEIDNLSSDGSMSPDRIKPKDILNALKDKYKK